MQSNIETYIKPRIQNGHIGLAKQKNALASSIIQAIWNQPHTHLCKRQREYMILFSCNFWLILFTSTANKIYAYSFMIQVHNKMFSLMSLALRFSKALSQWTSLWLLHPLENAISSTCSQPVIWKSTSFDISWRNSSSTIKFWSNSQLKKKKKIP